MDQLASIASQFQLEGPVVEIRNFGSGHIHKTYQIVTGAGSDDYILQQVNTNVFRMPDAVAKNIRLVTGHIHHILLLAGETDLKRKVLQPVQAKAGGYMFTDTEGDVWRSFIYIPGHKTYNKAIHAGQVFEGGRAFGNFLTQLADLEVQQIAETIPDFHNMEWRLKQFSDAVTNGLKERISETRLEIDQLLERQHEMLSIQRLGKEGRIPRRIVHHDTKINNVLYDENGKALCVIDLDTVMPGYVHDDFGDAIRTFTNTGEEDDINPDNISMNLSFFEAFARGYLETAGTTLNKTEIQYLPLSARIMTYMQVLRFLADYLNGDTYYRIHHPMHNLQRTRAQMKLLMSMEEQYDKMVKIVENTA
jgi:Ser/Thr protein kinase RdoA (MazF antagonist)